MDRHHGGPLSLECLAKGDAGPVVIVVDFLSPVKRLGRLLAEYSGGPAVYQIDPVHDLAACACYLTLEELAGRYSEALLAIPDDRPVVVVGYCSAAALALRIAGALAVAHDASLVLVSPSFPDIDMVMAEFSRFRASLGAAGDSITEIGTADPMAMLDDMVEILGRDIRSMAITKGVELPDDILTELVGRYYAWLGFLLASQGAVAGPAPHGFPVRSILAAGEDPAAELGSVCTATTRLPVLADDLTSSEALATEILTRRA